MDEILYITKIGTNIKIALPLLEADNLLYSHSCSLKIKGEYCLRLDYNNNISLSSFMWSFDIRQHCNPIQNYIYSRPPEN